MSGPSLRLSLYVGGVDRPSQTHPDAQNMSTRIVFLFKWGMRGASLKGCGDLRRDYLCNIERCIERGGDYDESNER